MLCQPTQWILKNVFISNNECPNLKAFARGRGIDGNLALRREAEIQAISFSYWRIAP
jgi:hypothetical protein